MRKPTKETPTIVITMSTQFTTTGYVFTIKLPGILITPKYCWIQHRRTPRTTPQSIPRKVISHPSSVKMFLISE